MADRDGFDMPPTSIAALQALSIAARRGEPRAPKLTPGALKLLEQLLAAPELAATLSISALAKQHDVNASSLTRLSHALGLTGFKAFQALFRADATTGAFYSTRAERLLDLGQIPSDGDYPVQRQTLWQEEMGNLSRTAERLDEAMLARAARALIDARRVHVVGQRACFAGAHYLAYYLGYLRSDVRLIDSLGGINLETGRELGEGDLVVGISYRPETRVSVDYCRQALDQGARLLALTNQETARLATMTDMTLLASAEGPFFFNPMSSLFVTIEMLLSHMAHEMGGDAVASIRRREALIARWQIE
ncbi:MurR/RpiR family transcriptional regulator [Salinicola corii]|uniref:MurR/RpiR family transcriptional regulator n=1 Tax=Salinicola corii TaxID=2606937 RepID=A0A640WCD8_9GAMM|nr:MurR/RpiR family transcriptional regulator [Salinicola corii]KAA0017459.1 MurR/RpiR family transcriptional regulator [Salinicola corii]MAM58687.1 RpiR family transcriptional regulator [Salinicola sp.]|tara:strand:+ start:341 stop:1258 length:918 start_codon:yes stop_codon:yes gene_type:complete